MADNVKYCHFQYPDATKMLIFTTTDDANTHLFIPNSYTIYEASYSIQKDIPSQSQCSSYTTRFYVDGKTILNEKSCNFWTKRGNYDTDNILTVGNPHTIDTRFCQAATVLIYQESN